VAGGGILDMQDLGDGRYQATMANGSTPIFTGDAGRQAYERLRKDQSAVGPNATAENSYLSGAVRGLANSVPLVGPLIGGAAAGAVNRELDARDVPASPPRKDAEGNRAGVTVNDGATSAPAQGAPQPQPADQPQAPPQAPPPNGALPYAAEGVDPATQKKVYGPGVMVNGRMMVDLGPGTKGSPGGVTALGKQVQKGREDADAMARPLEQQAAEAREQGVQLAIQQTEAQKAYLDEQRVQAMLQAQNERDEAMAAEQHVASLSAKADAAAEEFASSRMPEDSALTTIFQGLGASLGAFGASLGKTPNFAAEFIQQITNNKIRKWEAETNLKGKRADNLLARYKDALGDMKLAKVAVKETIMRQAAIEAEQMGLSTKSEQIANAWRATAAAAQAEGIRASQEKNEAFLLSFYGNKMLNAPATAGRAGGLVPATQGAFSERQDQQLNQANMDLKKQEAAREAANAGPGGKPVPAEVKKSIAELDAALAGIDRAEQVDKELGHPRNYMTEGGSWASKEANEIAAVANAIGPGVARATEGDAATKESMDRAVGGLTAGTPKQRAQVRDQYRQQLNAKRRAILGSQ
jgi:hypothetical protein